MNERDTPLSKHSAIKTSCHYKSESFINSALGGIILAEEDRDMHSGVEANHFALPNSEIWHCIYGRPITISFPHGNYYRIQFHHKGQGSTRVGQREFEVTPDQCVISPTAAHFNCSSDFQQTVLRISKAAVSRTITDLTGIVPNGPLSFETTFNPAEPMPEVFKNYFDFLLSSVNSSRRKMPPLILSEMERTLIALFICCCRNNYSDILYADPAQVAPKQVRRVEEYIEANWNQPISMSDILSISGCSARSIFRTFKKSRGYSPIAFVKQIRLRNARKELMTSDDSKITSTALACGFTDLGRFSRDYAKAFGELPSETIKRKKHTRLPK